MTYWRIVGYLNAWAWSDRRTVGSVSVVPSALVLQLCSVCDGCVWKLEELMEVVVVGDAVGVGISRPRALISSSS